MVILIHGILYAGATIGMDLELSFTFLYFEKCFQIYLFFATQTHWCLFEVQPSVSNSNKMRNKQIFWKTFICVFGFRDKQVCCKLTYNDSKTECVLHSILSIMDIYIHLPLKYMHRISIWILNRLEIYMWINRKSSAVTKVLLYCNQSVFWLILENRNLKSKESSLKTHCRKIYISLYVVYYMNEWHNGTKISGLLFPLLSRISSNRDAKPKCSWNSPSIVMCLVI